MASVVQICKMALSHIGSDATISSINPPDGSVEAGHCATFYDMARVEMLEPGNWAFSLKRATLAEVTNASENWLYAYAKPSDCLRPLRILKANSTVTVFNLDDVVYPLNDHDCADFAIEGGVIYANEQNAVLLYVRDVTDTGEFTPSFTSALSFSLAAYLAGPIIKGTDGLKIADAMRQRAMGMADVSATASANASAVGTLDYQPSIVKARA